MKTRKFLFLGAALAVACSAAVAQAADAAKNYPSRPIRLIMPNAPGSSADTIGRIVAAKLGDALGQQIVVDNRAGAGGVLGTGNRQECESGRLHADHAPRFPR